MLPKMTLREAQSMLGLKPHSITQKMKNKGLPFTKTYKLNYFTHTTARVLYKEVVGIEDIKPTVIAVQIVKGGTGKTALTVNLAARLSLLGFKVLMIDLDQQANLTRYCDIPSDDKPAMIDILEKGVKIQDAIIEAADGLFIIPSKIDNALLDDTILLRGLPLNLAIKKHIDTIKSQFDFILIDCPPSLGKSVGAAALSADFIIAPVTPDEQCLAGLRLLHTGLEDLKERTGRGTSIPYRIVVNQCEIKTIATTKMMEALDNNEDYRKRLFKNTIKKSQEFKNRCDEKQSVYDPLSFSVAKVDIDFLAKEVIEFTKQLCS
jgi:chromosome partitioning protein